VPRCHPNHQQIHINFLPQSLIDVEATMQLRILLAACVARIACGYVTPATPLRRAPARWVRMASEQQPVVSDTRRAVLASMGGASLATLFGGVAPASAKSQRALEFEARMAAAKGEEVAAKEDEKEQKLSAIAKQKAEREARETARAAAAPANEPKAPRMPTYKEPKAPREPGEKKKALIVVKDLMAKPDEDDGPRDTSASGAAFVKAGSKREEQKKEAAKRLAKKKKNQTAVEQFKASNFAGK